MNEIRFVSLFGTNITLYALLMGCGALAAALLMVLFAPARKIRRGGGALYALLGALLGLVLGRTVYCAVRWEWLFYDGMGNFAGIAPFFDFTQGGVNVIGVLLGVLLAAPLTGRLTKTGAARYLDAASVPGLFLFSYARFIEPLSGQGFGDLLFNESLCFFPLALENEFGDFSLSVCFIEGALALVLAIVLLCLRGRFRRVGTLTLLSLALLSALQIMPETLRVDDVLFVFIFARVSQIGFAVLFFCALAAALLHGKRRGLSTKMIVIEAGLLLLGIGICILAEFALDKTMISHALIFAVMIVTLAAMAALTVRRILKEDS